MFNKTHCACLGACLALGLVHPAGAETDPLEPTSPPAESADDETTHTESLQTTNYDEILVTASPHARRRFDVIQGTNTLSDEELERSIHTSLGETLAELPGISSTYYGPGASRPVIRGLDGPRIRVLQNGLGTLDASVTSPDHAVATDPLTAKRVEVIRGAGTLVYGSSAIGGVVNVDDGRIPTSAPATWPRGRSGASSPARPRRRRSLPVSPPGMARWHSGPLASSATPTI